MLRRLAACLLVAAPAFGCSADDPKEPIKIGLSASLSGFDDAWGMQIRDIVVATVDEINAVGGIDGAELELVIRDDGSEAAPAVAAVQALIDEGVVGIIGGFWSNQLEAVTPLVRDARIPLLSPSSTAPELIDMPADDGFVFRTAPNDDLQSLAMAFYLAEVAQPSSSSSIAIVHEDGSYGVGLAGALQEQWVDSRGRQLAGMIDFTADLDQAGATALWSRIAAANPSTIVMVSGGADANILIRTWQGSGQLPGVKWFLSDAAKQTDLFGDATTELPATIEGVRGSAPTYPRTGIAFQTFVDVIRDRTGMDVSQEAYFPNTWDAVYLLAAGLVQQAQAGDSFGGAPLRDAIASVSRGGQIFHAGQWRNLVLALRAGGDVDYDGAAGPVDFDPDGETLSPYEVWEARRTTAWEFAQVEYMDAADLYGP